MPTGEAYRAEKPGRFRLVFCMPEAVLREGIKRSASFSPSTALHVVLTQLPGYIDFSMPTTFQPGLKSTAGTRTSA